MVGYNDLESHVEIQGLKYRVERAALNGHIVYTTLSIILCFFISVSVGQSLYKPTFLGIQETRGEIFTLNVMFSEKRV